MQKVMVKSADGTFRELVLLEDLGDTLLLCSEQRYRTSTRDELADYAVGFPRSDVQMSSAENVELVSRG